MERPRSHREYKLGAGGHIIHNRSSNIAPGEEIFYSLYEVGMYVCKRASVCVRRCVYFISERTVSNLIFDNRHFSRG